MWNAFHLLDETLFFWVIHRNIDVVINVFKTRQKQFKCMSYEQKGKKMTKLFIHDKLLIENEIFQ